MYIECPKCKSGDYLHEETQDEGCEIIKVFTCNSCGIEFHASFEVAEVVANE